MIKIYGMPTCPDCTYLDDQIAGDDRYEKINIGEKTANLKEFLKIRDTSDAFKDIRGSGSIGIPCFVLEDGTVTLSPEDAGLKSRPETDLNASDVQKTENPAAGAFCSLDGKGC